VGVAAAATVTGAAGSWTAGAYSVLTAEDAAPSVICNGAVESVRVG
jgi:hypothetical protein